MNVVVNYKVVFLLEIKIKEFFKFVINYSMYMRRFKGF